MKKQPTRYPGVRWHEDVLYYRVILATGKRAELKFGRGGTPKDAFLAREERQELEDRIRNGRADPRQQDIETHAARPLLDLMEEFLDHMRDRGDGAGHVKNTEGFIREAIRVCGAKRILEMDAHRVNRWLAELALSARSKNARRTALLAFCRWAADFGRTPRNPLPSGLVPKFDEDADRRRLSRALTQKESRALFETMLDPKMMPKARGAGARRVFYLLAANTGLRWREIARLRWGDVDFETGMVIVPAGQTKNGKQAELPLVKEVLEALEGIRPENAEASASIFSGEPTLKTWKRDLGLAGLIGKKDAGYCDDRGRRIDRKCLRMSFCTWLKEAGVDLRDAQRLMRHSDPKLTAVTYTDIRISNLRAAVERIQQTPRTTPAKERAAG